MTAPVLLSDEELAAAVRTCARAMRDNPLHCAVFGGDPARRERRLCGFFTAVLPWIARRGTLFVLDDAAHGVIGMLGPSGCRPTITEKLQMLPALSRSMPVWTALRMRRWLVAWAKRDPATPHWHLGPLAVEPAHQRRGVGTRLLQRALARIDEAGGVAYLETDTEANVAFYRRFGFETVATASVVGVPSFFMSRADGAARDSRRPSADIERCS